MFEYKVVKRVEIPTINEEQLKEMLTEAVAKRLPDDVVVTNLVFNVKRQPTRVELDIEAQFADTVKKPVAKPVQMPTVELPEADDVIEQAPEEVTVTRDGALDKEMSLIDEVLAEEKEALDEPENEGEKPQPKSISELFNLS